MTFFQIFIYSFASGLLNTFFMEQIEHINKIELQGRVGTVRANEYNGSKVANFSMVTDYLYKSREGAAVIEGTWHNIVAWESKGVKDLDKIEKGVTVHVTGRLRLNKYTSAEGTEKQYYEVLANNLDIIESK